MYLAKGKLNSAAEHRFWQESEPQALINLIKDHFSDTDDDKQFRRTIRYLKRWKDVKFPSDGNAAPILALPLQLTIGSTRFTPVTRLQTKEVMTI